MDIDAIIFDLDGTLWDSCRVVSESWGETLRRLGCTDWEPKLRTIKSIMGMTAEEIAAALFSGYGARAREICLACIHGENDYIADHGGDVYPGVPAMLRALSGDLPLFIVRARFFLFRSVHSLFSSIPPLLPFRGTATDW